MLEAISRLDVLSDHSYAKARHFRSNLELLPDYEQRIEVLKTLKFTDDISTILLKGRGACELILENTLANYEPEEVVALISCLVFQEKPNMEPMIPPKLKVGRDAILAIIDRVDRVQFQHNVSEDMHARAKGMPFEQITSLTDVAEGTIVRVITRLDETYREIRDAARVIGDAELFKKMEEAQTKIHAIVLVFAASLYF
ncbi:hypothetical protein M422DRAFT_57912 [Sphaerobolus stellatus SS14]|nr:hypothetical protein M422DRAFT_57912 [Sphaerobolus stellatus SS14]